RRGDELGGVAADSGECVRRAACHLSRGGARQPRRGAARRSGGGRLRAGRGGLRPAAPAYRSRRAGSGGGGLLRRAPRAVARTVPISAVGQARDDPQVRCGKEIRWIFLSRYVTSGRNEVN